MSVVWQQRTHGVQKRKVYTDRRMIYFFLVVIVIATVLAAAYLSLVASNVHLSRRVWAMEQAMGEQERENHALVVEIAHLSSMPVLQQRSIEMGYAPAESVDFIQWTEP